MVQMVGVVRFYCIYMCIGCSARHVPWQHYMQADIYSQRWFGEQCSYQRRNAYVIYIFIYMLVGYYLLLAKMYCRLLSMSNLFTGLGQDGMQRVGQGGMQGGGQGGMQGAGRAGGESACVVMNV